MNLVDLRVGQQCNFLQIEKGKLFYCGFPVTRLIQSKFLYFDTTGNFYLRRRSLGDLWVIVGHGFIMGDIMLPYDLNTIEHLNELKKT